MKKILKRWFKSMNKDKRFDVAEEQTRQAITRNGNPLPLRHFTR